MPQTETPEIFESNEIHWMQTLGHCEDYCGDQRLNMFTLIGSRTATPNTKCDGVKSLSLFLLPE
jgi:hypothetical protein